MLRQSILASALVSLLLLGGSGGTRADERFTRVAELGKICDAHEVVDLERGTVACWVRLEPGAARRDHVIFHTDDSRIVLFLDTYWSGKREIVRFGARAGGNRRARDAGSNENFPEASIIIDNDGSLADYTYDTWYRPAPFREGEWHHLAMTWRGHPSGVVRIFLDGKQMGAKPYDGRYDDGSRAFRYYAAGYRPDFFPGERTSAGELRPVTAMALEAGGIAVRDLRVYRSELAEAEVAAIVEESVR